MTEGGLYIPQQAMERQQYRQWEIVQRGTKISDRTLLPGAWVIASGRFAGEPFTSGGFVYRIIFEEQVIATIHTGAEND